MQQSSPQKPKHHTALEVCRELLLQEKKASFPKQVFTFKNEGEEEIKTISPECEISLSPEANKQLEDLFPDEIVLPPKQDDPSEDANTDEAELQPKKPKRKDASISLLHLN